MCPLKSRSAAAAEKKFYDFQLLENESIIQFSFEFHSLKKEGIYVWQLLPYPFLTRKKRGADSQFMNAMPSAPKLICRWKGPCAYQKPILRPIWERKKAFSDQIRKARYHARREGSEWRAIMPALSRCSVCCFFCCYMAMSSSISYLLSLSSLAELELHHSMYGHISACHPPYTFASMLALHSKMSSKVHRDKGLPKKIFPKLHC